MNDSRHFPDGDNVKYQALTTLFAALALVAASACSIDDQLAGDKDQSGSDEPDLAATQLGSADSASSTYQGELA